MLITENVLHIKKGKFPIFVNLDKSQKPLIFHQGASNVSTIFISLCMYKADIKNISIAFHKIKTVL